MWCLCEDKHSGTKKTNISRLVFFAYYWLLEMKMKMEIPTFIPISRHNWGWKWGFTSTTGYLPYQ